MKRRVKGAVNFISRYEEAVARYAELHQADGIVCGHIHTPSIRRIRDIAYYNTGDWVESRTALVEHADGHIELRRWTQTDAWPSAAESPTAVNRSDRARHSVPELELAR